MKKKENSEKLYKYEEDYYYDYMRDHLDRIAQMLPKKKAFNKTKKVKCLTCDNVYAIELMNGAHWIPRAIYQFRWESWNIHCCCVRCNKYDVQKHINNLTLFMIETYGAEFVEEKLKQSKQIYKKPDIEFIEKKIKEVEAELKQYM